MRSCAACRARAPRDLLLRFVLRPHRGEGESPIRFDLDRLTEGRGLSVGPSPSCIERAVKRGAFQKVWKTSVSSEDLAVMVSEVRQEACERLRDYLRSLATRGGMRAVTSLDEVVPLEMKKLWEDDALRSIVSGLSPGAVTSARSAARIRALLCVVSEFTFARTGGIKRRLEPPEACEALERCGGGELRGSAKARHRRAGAGSMQSTPDGRDG